MRAFQNHNSGATLNRLASHKQFGEDHATSFHNPDGFDADDRLRVQKHAKSNTDQQRHAGGPIVNSALREYFCRRQLADKFADKFAGDRAGKS